MVRLGVEPSKRMPKHVRYDDIPTDFFTPRTYQVELLESALQGNTIACLGSASSKVFLGLMVIREMSHQIRAPLQDGGRRSVYLANTDEDVESLWTTCHHHTDLVVGKVMGGEADSWTQESWNTFLADHNILVLPASVFLTCLQQQHLSLAPVNLLVLDDCHLAVDDHPYVGIMEHVRECKESAPHLLCLTASILSSQSNNPEELAERISGLETMLCSKAETSMLVISERFGCRPREQTMECEEYEDVTGVADQLAAILYGAWHFLDDCQIEIEDYAGKSDPLHVPKFAISECINILQVLGPWCAASIAENLISQVEKIVKYECNQMLKNFLRYTLTQLRLVVRVFEMGFTPDYCVEELLTYTTPKVRQLVDILRRYKPHMDFMIITREGADDDTLSDMSDDDGNNDDDDSLDLSSDEGEDDVKNEGSKHIHIAVKKRVEVGDGDDPFEDEKKLCGLVFVDNRYVAFALNKMIEEVCAWDEDLCFVKSAHITGQGIRRADGRKDLSKASRKQEEVLRKFRMQERNLLISTSVLEEGVDIPKCNLVVRFDPPSDYRSYTLSKGRARARDAEFVILVDCDLLEDFSEELQVFKGIEQVLIGSGRGRQDLEDAQEVQQLDKIQYAPLPPFCPMGQPGGPAVTMKNAIALVNRYCAKLPSDAFTHLTPHCRVCPAPDDPTQFVAYLRLPVNSPIKEEVMGVPMPSRQLAKMAVALKMCELLYKAGELDNHLQPVGKEMFVCEEEEEWEGGEDEALGQARPGTTKRKQYYIKKAADAFVHSRPKEGTSCYLYHMTMVLTGPITEEQNTRGRKIYAPEETNQSFGILLSVELPHVPSFPVYTRSGEVTVAVELVRRGTYSDEQLEKLWDFHHFVFSSVLHLEKDPMVFMPETAASSFIIVPLNVCSENSTLDIDWTFVSQVNTTSVVQKRNVFDGKRDVFEFNKDHFEDAVVMPSYRNIDQPQHFYVAEIRWDLSPMSPFPSPELYKTFAAYYTTKYGLVLTNMEQPLLDVDHTSARLNLLTPRYMNQKGRALPTSSLETKRARRENLQQKQILVPELCDIHVFSASLWRKAVCLPAILYRMNYLLLAEELRTLIAAATGIGKVVLDPDFRFPRLDFGFETNPEKLIGQGQDESPDKDQQSAEEKKDENRPSKDQQKCEQSKSESSLDKTEEIGEKEHREPSDTKESEKNDSQSSEYEVQLMNKTSQQSSTALDEQVKDKNEKTACVKPSSSLSDQQQSSQTCSPSGEKAGTFSKSSHPKEEKTDSGASSDSDSGVVLNEGDTDKESHTSISENSALSVNGQTCASDVKKAENPGLSSLSDSSSLPLSEPSCPSGQDGSDRGRSDKNLSWPSDVSETPTSAQGKGEIPSVDPCSCPSNKCDQCAVGKHCSQCVKGDQHTVCEKHSQEVRLNSALSAHSPSVHTVEASSSDTDTNQLSSASSTISSSSSAMLSSSSFTPQHSSTDTKTIKNMQSSAENKTLPHVQQQLSEGDRGAPCTEQVPVNQTNISQPSADSSVMQLPGEHNTVAGSCEATTSDLSTVNHKICPFTVKVENDSDLSTDLKQPDQESVNTGKQTLDFQRGDDEGTTSKQGATSFRETVEDKWHQSVENKAACTGLQGTNCDTVHPDRATMPKSTAWTNTEERSATAETVTETSRKVPQSHIADSWRKPSQSPTAEAEHVTSKKSSLSFDCDDFLDVTGSNQPPNKPLTTETLIDTEISQFVNPNDEVKLTYGTAHNLSDLDLDHDWCKTSGTVSGKEWAPDETLTTFELGDMASFAAEEDGSQQPSSDAQSGDQHSTEQQTKGPEAYKTDTNIEPRTGQFGDQVIAKDHKQDSYDAERKAEVINTRGVNNTDQQKSSRADAESASALEDSCCNHSSDTWPVAKTAAHTDSAPLVSAANSSQDDSRHSIGKWPSTETATDADSAAPLVNSAHSSDKADAPTPVSEDNKDASRADTPKAPASKDNKDNKISTETSEEGPSSEGKSQTSPNKFEIGVWNTPPKKTPPKPTKDDLEEEPRSRTPISLDDDHDLETFVGPSPCLLLQALTMSNANDFFSLERLETIGDSFLKYAITVYLYCCYPGTHEGKLSYLRSKQVSNYNLYRLGRRKGLAERMVSSKFEPYENWLPPGYVISEDRRRGPVPKVVIATSNPKLSAAAPVNFLIEEEETDTDGQQKRETAAFHKEVEEINRQQADDEQSEVVSTKKAMVPYSLQLHHGIPDKSVADCVEALIGCYLTTCGKQAALTFMSWLGLKVLPRKRGVDRDARRYEVNMSEFEQLRCPPSPLIKSVPNADEILSRLLEGFSEFEAKINYRFNDRSYLLQAFTHASYHYNYITDCYQRLEFLGDAILDYVITRHLYEDSQRYSPGILTDLRSALVNNNIFAALAVKWDFHKYFKAISPSLFAVIDKFVIRQKEREDAIDDIDEAEEEEEEEEGEFEGEAADDAGTHTGDEDVELEIPKALGDIFESVAGAIYLDSGMSLDTVWRVYYSMMKPHIDKYLKDIPKSPVRELLEMEPETAKFEKPERTLDGKIRVTVNVVGKGVFCGVGRNYRIAKSAAAKKALRFIRNLQPEAAV